MQATLAEEITPFQRAAIMVSVMMATTIYALDLTVANVALPHMMGTFSSTQDQISWVLTSYVVASAVATPCSGWLAGRFGRKRLFETSVAGFVVTSIICGTANSLEVEVLARLVQGMFGAFLLPLSQSIVMDIFPPEKLNKAMAIWGLGILIGPVMGPVVGGYLTDIGSWRWVFFINIPAGLVAFIGVYLFIPQGEKDLDRSFDWTGFFALALALAATQTMLDRGERNDWFDSPEILIELGVALVALYVFVVHSLTTKHPFLKLHLLLDRNYSVGLVLIFAFGLMQLAPIVLLPPLLQDLRDFPITTIGILLTPRGIGLFFAMTLAGRLLGKLDNRLVIGAGFVIVAFSTMGMASWNLEIGMWDVAWTGVALGVGAGMIWMPLSTLTFATLPVEDRVEATSVFHLLRNMGSSIGISAALTVLARMTTENHATLVENISPFNEMTRFGATIGQWDMSSVKGMAALDSEVMRQATMIGYVDSFYLFMWTTLAAVPLVLLLGSPKPEPVAE